MGRVWGKAGEGGAGAFDELQKSRPVINQAGIRPGEKDPEHLLGRRGRHAGDEGGQGSSTLLHRPTRGMPAGDLTPLSCLAMPSLLSSSVSLAVRCRRVLSFLLSLLPQVFWQMLGGRQCHRVGATGQGGPLPSPEN